MQIVLAIAAIMIICLVMNHDYEYKSNKPLGNHGENIVSNKLKLLDDTYVIENNVHIGHSQIDHLVINHKLKICFVIETKYWGGKVTGNRNDK